MVLNNSLSTGGEPREISVQFEGDVSHRGNPKRQQIMHGARQVFLERGFDGASIGDIVRVAGVSKGTLYAYFPSKEKLFETLIFEDRRLQAEQTFRLDHKDSDIRGVLETLGMRFVALLMAPDAVSHLRTVIAAAAQFPEIGRAFYDAGPKYGISQLAAYLTAQREAGRLSVAEPERAAAQFMDLCKSGVHIKVLCGIASEIPEAELKENVAAAVTMFLTAYSHRDGPDAI
jgi:AcrR family transcriptional regulator